MCLWTDFALGLPPGFKIELQQLLPVSTSLIWHISGYKDSRHYGKKNKAMGKY